MRRLPLTLSVLVLLVLPGCISSLQEPAAPASEGPAVDGATDDEPRNRFLLDAPRPFTARVGVGAEPDILVDDGGEWIWMGDTYGVYRSKDGGQTWQTSPNEMFPHLLTRRILAPPYWVILDGWAFAQDDAGTLYATTTSGPTVGVYASDNGGLTWRTSNPFAGLAAIADRPWLAARNTGEVALIYNALPLGARQQGTYCAYSTDGGATFVTNNLLSPQTTTAPPGVIAGNAVFGPDGGLYFAIAERVYRYRVPCQGNYDFLTLPGSGQQLHTNLRVDDAGDVYVAQPTVGNGAVELRGYHGMDRTTLKRLVVTPPDLKSNTFATLDVRPGADEVAVAWYGSETNALPDAMPNSGVWNVYVARIQGFWSANPTITWDRITTEPNHAGPFCLGGTTCDTDTASDDRDLLDYFHIDFGTDGRLHLGYAHNTPGAQSAETRYAVLGAR